MNAQTLQSFAINMPISSLNNYISAVNQIPFLTDEEEKKLSERWFYEQDISSARQLVLSHLRFVVKVARSFSGYGLCLADLIQEGNIGLMKAVKRFDPTVGVRLVSFAIHWIKAELHAFVLKNWRIVRVATTKAQRKLFFNLRSMKNRLSWFSKEDVALIAEELKVKPETVREMELRLIAQDYSFDAPTSESDEEGKKAFPSEYLQLPESDPYHLIEREQREKIIQDKLTPALELLNTREQEVIRARWMNEIKSTLKELAEKFGISIERVRQIEAAALLKLRNALS